MTTPNGPQDARTFRSKSDGGFEWAGHLGAPPRERLQEEGGALVPEVIGPGAAEGQHAEPVGTRRAAVGDRFAGAEGFGARYLDPPEEGPFFKEQVEVGQARPLAPSFDGPVATH